MNKNVLKSFENCLVLLISCQLAYQMNGEPALVFNIVEVGSL